MNVATWTACASRIVFIALLTVVLPGFSDAAVTLDGIQMVLLPEGSFEMGSADGLDNEKPVHTVTLDSFYISEAEITNAQYAAYLNAALAAGAVSATATSVTGVGGDYNGLEYIYLAGEFNAHNKCWISYSSGAFTVESGKESYPATYVTWYGARAFARFYNFDLPTEAQWEYAAKGGRGYVYGTDDGTISTSKANYNHTLGRITGVKSYPANPFGLYDMAGNANELCLDWYDAYTAESVRNPVGAYEGTLKAIRGGNWQTSQTTCRTSFRTSIEQADRTAHVGFRVIRRIYHMEGRVLERGTGLSGVNVRIVGPDLDVTLVTDASGSYNLTIYKTGTYQVSPSKSGYMFFPYDTETTVSDLLTTVEDLSAVRTLPDQPAVIEGFRFAYLPAGIFTMGSDTGQANEKPAHFVTMEPYYLAEMEITNTQYAAYLNEAYAAGAITVTGAMVKGATGPYAGMDYIDLGGYYNQFNECWIDFGSGTFSVASGKGDLPVMYVTWYGASAFAEHYGFRLPSEAEWEYAAKGGSGFTYGTDNGAISDTKANYNSKANAPVNVGSYPANPFGLYDMAGNAAEYCLDWYDAYTAERQHAPVGGHTGDYRAYRGGHWQSTADPCRTSFRISTQKDSKSHLIGFRVACSIRTLEGRIVESGAGLPDVTVTLTGPKMSLTTTTNADGWYEYKGIGSGIFTVEPSKEGYTFRPRSMQVTVDDIIETAPEINGFPEGSSMSVVIDGVNCIMIPHGTFMMGSATGASNEQPVHEVTLDAFYMSETEITNTLYAAYLNAALGSGKITVSGDKVYGSGGAYNGKEYIYLGGYFNAYNKCWITYSNGVFASVPDKGGLPVVFVTWYGAKSFADHYGFKLPTEAEWEYAASAGLEYEYGTDDGAIGATKANYNSIATSPVAVKSYPVNPFGLYDMSGNVAEYCLDWYDAYTAESATNPVGGHTGENRALRGGHFKSDANACRASYRVSTTVEDKSYMTGFRVVRHVLTLQGRVVENGAGISGVRVTATGGGYSFSGTSSETGVFRITVISTGNYSISATAQHYYFTPSSRTVTVDEAYENIGDINANLLDPPSNATVHDVPDDHGHSLRLTWTLSPDDAVLTGYNIYRSRKSTLTAAVDISTFTAFDDLKAAEQTTTILIATVPKGTAEYLDNAVPTAGVNYYYWLQAVKGDAGSAKVAAEFATAVETNPLEFSVGAPYPNPFNPATTIEYSLPGECHVRLTIYDVLGREVAVLRDGIEHGGSYAAVWNGTDGNGVPVGSGVYLYRLTAGKHIARGKMMLMR